jgi:hypothetical protein
VLAVLQAAGLPPANMAAAFRIQGYFIHGALMAHAATRAAAARPDYRMTEADLLADSPLVASVLPHLQADRLEAIMDSGLDLILDGLEHRYLPPPATAAD